MDDEAVSNRCGIGGILDSILKGFEYSGKNLQSLIPNDLLQLMNSIQDEKNSQ